MYRQTSSIKHTLQKLKCLTSRLATVFAQSTEATEDVARARPAVLLSCQWSVAQQRDSRPATEDVHVVGAAPTGNAPATSEWSTILLPTKMPLM